MDVTRLSWVEEAEWPGYCVFGGREERVMQRFAAGSEFVVPWHLVDRFTEDVWLLLAQTAG